MKRPLQRVASSAVLTLGVLGGFALAHDPGERPGEPATSGIEGSYELVRRVLPDGRELRPPDVVGFLTYTSTHRNFNVRWGDEANPTSLSYVCKYTLTADEYREEPLHWMEHNLRRPGVSFDPPAAKSERSEVSREGGAIRFDMKGEPVVMRFSGETLTATAEGQFVDHWRKVD